MGIPKKLSARPDTWTELAHAKYNCDGAGKSAAALAAIGVHGFCHFVRSFLRSRIYSPQTHRDQYASTCWTKSVR
eukprot:6498493-Pyramimonas_sp.AAC.1